MGDVSKGINPKAERMRLQADAERERRDVERKRAESAYTLKVLVEEWAALHLARYAQNCFADICARGRNNFGAKLSRQCEITG